jgi:membrane associated rhomboid family serine protease
MLILPIRTESETRRPPRANVMLIGLNLGFFLLFEGPMATKTLSSFRDQFLAFQSDAPAMYQFLTYQFLHADIGHLLGNMIFLWVFGNSVNGKMGDFPYALFYLAGGIFAAWGYASVRSGPFELVGASGAIASITTAYLALFPRSHVTTLVWFFFFIHFFELPAMLLIGLKIIVWDNIVAPAMGGATRVAYGAHLAGYLFGFVASLALLMFRGVPRDQFDILAVWRRWLRRREMRSVMGGRGIAGAQYGRVARDDVPDSARWEIEHRQLDQLTEFRTRITQALAAGNDQEAADLYEQLVSTDPRQCLSEMEQLAVARQYYASGRVPQALAAFARFVECYPSSPETPNIRLLLGIIYARDLSDFEAADAMLTSTLDGLRDMGRREQCLEWLRKVRLALGRPMPGAG